MKREELIRKVTNNLGKIEETENELICRVDISRIKKLSDKYSVTCTGIREEDLELAIEYGLNKRIVYLLEKFELDHKKLHISGMSNCDIIIRNCRINTSALDVMNTDGSIRIEDSTISGLSAWSTLYAKKMLIRNTNMSSMSTGKSFRLCLGAAEYLGMSDSNIEISNAMVEIAPESSLSIVDTKVTVPFKVGNTQTMEANSCILNIEADLSPLKNLTNLESKTLRR